MLLLAEGINARNRSFVEAGMINRTVFDRYWAARESGFADESFPDIFGED